MVVWGYNYKKPLYFKMKDLIVKTYDNNSLYDGNKKVLVQIGKMLFELHLIKEIKNPSQLKKLLDKYSIKILKIIFKY